MNLYLRIWNNFTSRCDSGNCSLLLFDGSLSCCLTSTPTRSMTNLPMKKKIQFPFPLREKSSSNNFFFFSFQYFSRSSTSSQNSTILFSTIEYGTHTEASLNHLFVKLLISYFFSLSLSIHFTVPWTKCVVVS